VQQLLAVAALGRIYLMTEIDFGGGRHLGPQLADHRSELAYYVQDDRKLCLNFEAPFSRNFSDSPFLLSETAGPRVSAGSLLGLERPEGRLVAIHHRGTPGWHLDRESGLARNVLAGAPVALRATTHHPGSIRRAAVRGLISTSTGSPSWERTKRPDPLRLPCRSRAADWNEDATP
jgi:hypothetical protein